ncbi:hypothetical protein POM88_033296 [Heracleum sosnowskyi]|uniref:Translation initiation factor IF- 2 domain-containing protein n=1 Tax=Heracleum sosnowskyi TaxID=360622 RepID=A0AAD8MM46_9APIA|nr:hypothetical protein POM88_033296 [Heracleum sosnowskyi]
MAGDDITAVESEDRGRMLSAGREKNYEKDRLMKINEDKAVSPELSEDADVPERVEMRVIVKADVQGSVQAVTDAFKSLNISQVFINVVHVGVGSITQSDLDLAQACGACIVGFNVKGPSGCVGMSATQTGDKVSIAAVYIGISMFSDLSGLHPNTSKSQCFFGNVPSDVIVFATHLTSFHSNFFLWHDPFVQNRPLLERFGSSITSLMGVPNRARAGQVLDNVGWVHFGPNHGTSLDVRSLLSSTRIEDQDSIYWNDLRAK